MIHWTSAALTALILAAFIWAGAHPCTPPCEGVAGLLGAAVLLSIIVFAIWKIRRSSTWTNS